MTTAHTIRTLALALLGLASAGAAYLWAVRGEALLFDLAAGLKGLLCL